MRNVYKVGGLIVAILLLIGLGQSTAQSQASGFYIDGRHLYDANGNQFIMRGISHPHTWYTGETSSFANIKDTGANTVRVVLSSGDRWTRNDASDVANVIQLCKENRLICVLEVHDTTGYGEEGAAVPLSQAVDYWTSIQSVLTGEEAYIIINIGNEPYGNNNTSGWVDDTMNAIAEMRSAGFDHTLMIDAPNWGQDWEGIMRQNAAQIFASDPDANLLFDIHMYGVYDTASEVESYLSTFVDNGLPLVIGEFGHNHSDGDPDEDAIMSWAETYDIGYIGWSWSGNGGGVEYLDMVNNFDPNSLTSWGERIINGANGIAQTSQEASVYSGSITPTPTNTPGGPTLTPTPPPTSTPIQPTATPVPGGPCVVEYNVINQWNTQFQASVTITNNSSSTINGWELTFTHAPGQQVTGGWGADIVQIGDVVTASNPPEHWNGTIAPNGGSVAFAIQATYEGSVIIPTDFVLNGTACNEGTPPPTPTATTVPPTATPTTVPPTATPATPTSTPTTAPPTATPGDGGCAVDYALSDDWGSGFVANVTVTNNSGTSINGWQLDWSFAGNQTITNLWGGNVSQNGSDVSVTNADWNATIASGGTAGFGFQATYSGSNAVPAAFTLNGVACDQ